MDSSIRTLLTPSEQTLAEKYIRQIGEVRRLEQLRSWTRRAEGTAAHRFMVHSTELGEREVSIPGYALLDKGDWAYLARKADCREGVIGPLKSYYRDTGFNTRHDKSDEYNSYVHQHARKLYKNIKNIGAERAMKKFTSTEREGVLEEDQAEFEYRVLGIVWLRALAKNKPFEPYEWGEGEDRFSSEDYILYAETEFGVRFDVVDEESDCSYVDLDDVEGFDRSDKVEVTARPTGLSDEQKRSLIIGNMIEECWDRVLNREYKKRKKMDNQKVSSMLMEGVTLEEIWNTIRELKFDEEGNERDYKMVIGS